MSGRLAFSTSGRRWWAAMTEVILAASLIIAGVILLVASVTLAVIYSTPDKLYTSVWFLVLQILAAIALIGIGTYRTLATFWKVAASAERRSAIVSRAGDIELLNEIRNTRTHLPTVPGDKYPPIRGVHQSFQLFPSKRNLWGFGVSAALSLLFLILATILIITSVKSYRVESINWFATGLAIPICAAAGWSIYLFVKQLLALTGVGPPILEISNYPLEPGATAKLHLSQTGRVRLKLLDVFLVCIEEATFDQGTDIRTEKKTVYEQRLFRRRGINLRPAEPFESEFELALPEQAMHSFQSPNNRISWKIVIQGLAKGWPRQERKFTVSVLPRQSQPKRKA